MMTGLLLLASLVASLVAETQPLGIIVLEDQTLPEQHVHDSALMELLIQQEEILAMTGTF